MAAVRLLPEAATRQLRAGPVAVDVVQCVEELVLNAVDAGATHIRVEVCGIVDWEGTSWVKRPRSSDDKK